MSAPPEAATGVAAAGSWAPGPRADDTGVTFRFPDPQHRLVAVSLVQEVAVPRLGPEFQRVPDGWEVRLARPAVTRMEYLLELLHPDGGTELIRDPHNPHEAPGPFGPKSVVQFPDYRAPAWTAGPDIAAGSIAHLEVPCATLGCAQPVQVWTSAGSTGEQALPLLVVLDGVEYARYSALVCMLDRLAADSTLPPMRAALLQPVARDEHYSASPAFATAMGREILPAVHRRFPVAAGRAMRVGMGASLGALAMLHAHRTQPSTFGGLFLQSGSFFHHRYDRHEIGFEHFQRIRWFMDRVHGTRQWDQPIPVRMTCGRVEMNFANNRAASLVLRSQGYDVRFAQMPDAHNWIGWRDALHPALVDLLRELWT